MYKVRKFPEFHFSDDDEEEDDEEIDLLAALDGKCTY